MGVMGHSIGAATAVPWDPPPQTLKRAPTRSSHVRYGGTRAVRGASSRREPRSKARLTAPARGGAIREDRDVRLGIPIEMVPEPVRPGWVSGREGESTREGL